MAVWKVSKDCGRFHDQNENNDIPWGKNAIEIIEDVTKKYISVLYNLRTYSRQ
jgi:hypothetical protein